MNPVALLAAVLLLAPLSASAQTPAASTVIVFQSSGDAGFDAWRADFAARALAAGRDRAVVEAVLTGLTPEPRVIEQDRNQPEFVRPVWDYVERAVSATRLERGRVLRAELAPLFQRIEETYGVDADVIAGIWAMETNFGAAALPHDAARAIATLAHEGRRRPQFETYLLALIEMVERGYAGARELRSSWAGALGQPQFMPDVYLSDAVDWNGDGRRDIWTDQGDALASIANYLARRGWVRGGPVLDEVRVPAGFDYALADGRYRTVADWAAAGVVRIDARPFSPEARALEAQLSFPAGAQGPTLLLYRNFAVIRRYNPSDRYSLAVTLLARSFEGAPGLQVAWPRQQGWLQRADVLDLQTRLAAAGFDPGRIDGVMGAATRSAVRAYQTREGLTADGWPTLELLARLRGENDEAAKRAAAHTAAQPLARRADILRLQRALAARGAPIGRPTGTVGPRTRAGIEALERELGLPVTGRATDFILAEAERSLTRAATGSAASPRRSP